MVSVVTWVVSLLVVFVMRMTWHCWLLLHLLSESCSIIICEDFAKLHGLRFNANKTQFVEFSQEVIHLGHTLLENLDDSLDISRKTKDLMRRANYILCTFSHLLTLLFSQC